MKTYAGIDLHSSNNYIGILDDQGRRLFGKRLPNDIDSVLTNLEPFKTDLEAVVVESTYNWYWLVDGLQAAGYNVRLANPAAMKQYEGLKYTDDESDSFWLAQQKQLGILKEGYIYPKEDRPVRDLLRRRLLFVRHKTAYLLSLQSMVTRNLGIRISGSKVKSLTKRDLAGMFDSEHLILMAENHLEAICFLQTVTNSIERAVKSHITLKREFKMLLSIPGIGDILGLTIMLEVGNINRFKKVGCYSSYCRCVKSQKTSNDKKKGEGNRKNGNRYLSWAYVEAANFARRYCAKAQKIRGQYTYFSSHGFISMRPSISSKSMVLRVANR